MCLSHIHRQADTSGRFFCLLRACLEFCVNQPFKKPYDDCQLRPMRALLAANFRCQIRSSYLDFNLI